jgi:hypothetical protein
VEELCQVLIVATGAEARVTSMAGTYITDGEVVIPDASAGDRDPSAAGRLLHALLSEAIAPAPLRLFVVQASSSGSYATLQDFAKALAYYGKPGREDLIRALYRRCLAAKPAAPAVTSAPVEKPPSETPAKTVSAPAKRGRKWIGIAAAILLAAGGTVLYFNGAASVGSSILPSRLVAQARDAAAKLAVGLGLDEPAAAPPEVLPDPPGRGSSVAAKLTTVAKPVAPLASRPAAPRSRARSVMPLPTAPTARPLSEQLVEVDPVTYSQTDVDVDPPVLLHPQLPPNLILAGENRMNVMELIVTETGAVERVQLIAGPSRLPDVMLLSGAKAWRFKPASLGGEAVRYRAVVSWAGTP